MRKILTCTLVLNFLITAITAEERLLTVEQSVILAVENNLSLQSTAIDVRTKKRARDTAWNVFIPGISASTDLGQNRTLLSDPETSTGAFTDPTWELNAGISLDLPLNLAAGTGIKQTLIDYEAGRLDYEDAEKQLERDVRKQFYSLIASKANIELKKVNIRIAVKRYEQARENYSNGLISELEMLQTQVAAENKKPELNGLETRFKNGLMSFKMLLGIPLSDEIRLEGSLENLRFFRLNAEELIGNYSAGRMDIQQINKQIESLENTRRVQKQYNQTPTLSLYSRWGTLVYDPFDNPSWESGSWADNFKIGLLLSLPLDGFIPRSSTDVALKDLKDSLEKLNLQKKQISEAAAMEISNLVMNLENSRLSLETYALNVDLAEKSFNLTSEAYYLGTRELLDVESAQEELMIASQNVLIEKINYITNLLDLQYAINADNLPGILEER